MAAYEANTLIESALLLTQDPMALIELGLLLLTATYLCKLSLQSPNASDKGSSRAEKSFGPQNQEFFSPQRRASSKASLRSRSVSQLRNHFFNVGSLISFPSRSLYQQTC